MMADLNPEKHLKTLLFFMSFYLCSLAAWAQDERCIEALNQNYTTDMSVYKLSNDDVEEFDQLNEETALLVVDRLLKKETPCSIQDINHNIKVSCTRLIQNSVCEVATSIGYFMVHRGSFGHFMYSVTWGRWD